MNLATPLSDSLLIFHSARQRNRQKQDFRSLHLYQMKFFLIILIACFTANQNFSFGKVSIAYETKNSASEIQIDRTFQHLAMSWDLEKNKRVKITFELSNERTPGTTPSWLS